jgi:hypothetical protein
MSITITKQDYNDLCDIWHIAPKTINAASVNIDSIYFKLTSEQKNPYITYVKIPCNASRGRVNAVLYYLSNGQLVVDANKCLGNLTKLVNPRVFFDNSTPKEVDELARGSGNAYQEPKTVDRQS